MHATALNDLRRRGQFVVGALCWAAVAGFLATGAGWLLVFYHYGLSLAEHTRIGLGFRAPQPGVADWYLLTVMALPLIALAAAALAAWVWYRRVWSCRLAAA